MVNLSQVIRRLIQGQVEFVLVGGFAAVAHGSSMGTQDVDICCPLTLENLTRLHQALADIHPRHRSYPDLPFEITPELCKDLKNLYLRTDLSVLDCLGEILGVGDYEAVKAHSIELQLPSGSCRVLDLDTLILAKEAVGRRRDIETVALLKAIKNKLNASNTQPT